MRSILTLSAVALMTPLAGLAQTTAPANSQIDVGSKVRVAAPVFGTRQKQVGTVVALTPDTVVLRLGASVPNRSLAHSDITSLEVARGKRSQKARGALWGTVIGAGAGAILGYALYTDPCGSDGLGCVAFTVGPTSRGGNAAISAVGGGLVGALIGTLVGRRQTDTWVPGTLPAR